jgi:peptidyl-dipeptidase Dcp
LSESINPLLQDWTGPLGAPPFEKIRTDDFLPAFKWAIDAHDRELAAIRSEDAPADFDNVLAALERAGEPLARVRRIFWTLSSAQSNDAMRAIEADMSALQTRHSTSINQDPALYRRVADVFLQRDTAALTPEQQRLAKNIHDGFVFGGAALGTVGKKRLAAINEQLSALSVRFSQNVLAATNAWKMVLDKGDLDGLPDDVRSAAAARAEAAGEKGRYLFTLDRTDFEAFLTFSARRGLRERMWGAFTTRCEDGEFENVSVIAEILKLRTESAQLLGYPDYAAYKLDGSMAATADAAQALLERIWEPAKAQAAAEAAELQMLIDADGGDFTLAAWDWRFYAERVRRERYALDGAALKQYLRLGTVRTAAFEAAGRLYGLQFQSRKDVPVYHPTVDAWDVRDARGKTIGLVYTDYLSRAEKYGGAWMGSLRVQETLDGPVLPIVYTVANFAAAPDPADTRLSLDEARTLFHEFGHALHGLLSNVTYPSLSGTAVARDFVEFPSKFMEHWIIDPAVLAKMGVPADLIEAIGRAEAYGQGFATVELTAASLIDLALHRAPAIGADPMAFTVAELARLGTPDAIGMRHRLTYFTHIFDGGYASAYYSYLWSEVLDADAFEAFVEAGDIFDPATAARFRDEILGQGDKRDPMLSFIAFRGRAPDETPLLRSRGLLAVA